MTATIRDDFFDPPLEFRPLTAAEKNGKVYLLKSDANYAVGHWKRNWWRFEQGNDGIGFTPTHVHGEGRDPNTGA